MPKSPPYLRYVVKIIDADTGVVCHTVNFARLETARDYAHEHEALGLDALIIDIMANGWDGTRVIPSH